MDESRFIWLFHRYTAGDCTDAEKQEYLNVVKQGAYDLLLQELISTAIERAGADRELTGAESAAMLKVILETPVVKVLPLKRSSRLVWWAAAAFLILFSTVAWLLITKNKQPGIAIIPDKKVQDVMAPRSNRATIILAGGQTVFLDSVQSGRLAWQGHVKLEKLADGQIAYNGTTNETVYNTLINPRGSKVIHLTLADGSKIWLNTASSVTYPAAFTGKERRIKITGEAYFEVAPIQVASPGGKGNHKLPFIVDIVNAAGDVKSQVEVLGTHFNINAYDDEASIKTTLLEGKVQVKSAIGSRQSAVLKPGEQVSLSQTSQLSQPIPVQTDAAVAWKNGLFHFEDDRLDVIMRQVARWYNASVVYEDPVQQLRFGGIISRRENVSAVLKLLEATGVIHFEIKDQQIIVKQ